MRNPLTAFREYRHGGWHIFERPAGVVFIALYKIIWGAFETLLGLMIYGSYRSNEVEQYLDVQDRFFDWFLGLLHAGSTDPARIGQFIAVLGLIKMALGFGIFYRLAATRRIAMMFFGAVGLYGIWHLAMVSMSLFGIAALVTDIGIFLYFWLILPRHAGDRGLGRPEII